MATTSKIGGGRFSALDSSDSPSQRPSTSSVARMLTESEKKSLRDFFSRSWDALKKERAESTPATRLTPKK